MLTEAILHQIPVQTRCFAATDANIDALLAFVAQVSHMVGFDSAAADEIQLAVAEAGSNIIKHGYGREGSARSSAPAGRRRQRWR